MKKEYDSPILRYGKFKPDGIVSNKPVEKPFVTIKTCDELITCYACGNIFAAYYGNNTKKLIPMSRNYDNCGACPCPRGSTED